MALVEPVFLDTVDVARLSGAAMVVTDNRRHFTTLMKYGIRVLQPMEFANELPPS